MVLAQAVADADAELLLDCARTRPTSKLANRID
jgi:hypothetical protein